MELDDLRRQWQQPGSTSEPELTDQKLQAMLATQADTPISEMLRNARRDQRLMLVMILINVGNITNLSRRFTQGGTLALLYVAVAGMMLFGSWYAYRQWQLIRQLQQGDGATAGHLRDTVRRLRVFLHNKLYARLVFLATIFLIVGYRAYDAVFHDGQSGRSIGVVVLGAGAALTLVAALLYLAQRRQQRRYGQHLDRLESLLRELHEPAA